jgi:hypothetical protein
MLNEVELAARAILSGYNVKPIFLRAPLIKAMAASKPTISQPSRFVNRSQARNGDSAAEGRT